jgi:hypothetical protein
MEHSLLLQGCLDVQRRYVFGRELSIANRQNCLEALLQEELGLYSLWSTGSALEENLQHCIYFALLSLRNISLNPWAEFGDP